MSGTLQPHRFGCARVATTLAPDPQPFCRPPPPFLWARPCLTQHFRALPVLRVFQTTAMEPESRVPVVAWGSLSNPRPLGSGFFGDVSMMDWAARGLTVAVKCNGINQDDADSIRNESRLYDKLLTSPHDNILPLYGVCTDAPDGKVRLLMKLSARGSVSAFLKSKRPEVSGLCLWLGAAVRQRHRSQFVYRHS
jgi:hypothetical protein